MINPAKLLQFSKDWKGFEGRHPKFVMFLKSAMQSGVGVDSIVDIQITLPDGRKIESNMKICPEDVEFIKNIGSMGK